MELKETRDILEKFAKYVVRQARTNLTKQKKNTSKNLYNSIKYVPKDNGLRILFEMLDYGEFQDKGVRGAKSYYADQATAESPYKFGTGSFAGQGDKFRKSIDKWMVKKNVFNKSIRDKKGRFIPRKSLAYLITRSIYSKGIRASMFFTKPFEKAFNDLPPELRTSFVKDIENSIE
jgi:hypothetical protein